METIEYYLVELTRYKTMLASYLRELGIDCSDEENYNTLIPKIYDLSTEGEVIVEDYALRDFDGTEEECAYIMEHVIPTGQQGDMKGKFYNTPNLKVLNLNRFNITSSTTNLHQLFAPDTSTNGVAPVETFIMENKNGVLNSATYYDHYPNLKRMVLKNTTINNRFLSTFLAYTISLEELELENIVYSDTTLNNCFYNDSYNSNTVLKNLDLSEISYENPITSISGSFSRFAELETINLGNFEFADTLLNLPLFSVMPKLRSFLFPLSKLENKQAYEFKCKSFDACLDDLIFPVMTLTSTSSFPLLLEGFNSVKNVDISQITFSIFDTDENISLSRVFSDMGSNYELEDLNESSFIGCLELLRSRRISNLTYCFDNCHLLQKNIVLTDFMSLTASSIYLYNAFSGTFIDSFTLNDPEFNNSVATISWSNMFKNSTVKNISITLGVCKDLKFEGLLTLATNLESVYINATTIATSAEIQLISGYDDASKLNALKSLTLENMNNLAYMSPHYMGVSVVTNMMPYLEHVEYKNCTYTTNVSARSLFNRHKSVTLDIGGIDFSNVNNILEMLYQASDLENLVLCTNLGKNFGSLNAGSVYAKLDLHYSTKLTHTSIMDVFNKLYDLNLTYDVANGGTLYTQQLIIGATNIAKMTAEELAIVTNKGWTVS